MHNILGKSGVLKTQDVFCCLCSAVNFAFLCVQITDIKAGLGVFSDSLPDLRQGCIPHGNKKGKKIKYWN